MINGGIYMISFGELLIYMCMISLLSCACCGSIVVRYRTRILEVELSVVLARNSVVDYSSINLLKSSKPIISRRCSAIEYN